MERETKLWNLVFDWFGNGKKMIVGGLFFLAGAAAQSFSTKTLQQIPFLLMAAGLMCFVNALFSKMYKTNINLLLFLLINIAAIDCGIFFTSHSLPGSAGAIDSMTVALIWIVCILAVWALQALILPLESIPRRAGAAFLETLLSAAAVLTAFIIPIMLSVFL